MKGTKIAAGWLINLHTFSNLQLLLATLTVASKFTDWIYVKRGIKRGSHKLKEKPR